MSDRIASPTLLLELVDAALEDVAAQVPLPLLVTELDRAARSLAAMGDLVVTFRDRLAMRPTTSKTL